MPLPLAELELAHAWGLETRRGQSMWFYNWGNLSAGGFVDGEERLSWPGDVWRPSWFELAPDASPALAAVHERMLAGQAPSAFRALHSHDEGARQFVDLLESAKFRSLVQAGLTGSPEAYARAIYDSGYCRDRGCQPANSAPQLASLVAEFRRDHVFDSLGLPVLRPASSSSSSGAELVALLVLWKVIS
jgi:hypothetical protein